MRNASRAMPMPQNKPMHTYVLRQPMCVTPHWAIGGHKVPAK